MHSFYASYVPYNKEAFQLGYIGKPSKRLCLFSELRGTASGQSDSIVGFRVKFMEGMLTGTLTTSGKASAVYKHYIESVLCLTFGSQLDFQRPEKPATFGISLSMGAM